MAGAGLMTLRRLPHWRVRLSLLDQLLNDGYIYCAYYWGGSSGRAHGHAIVIYGVEPCMILFMDPGRGRYVREPESFFARQRASVVLGISVLPGLRRSVGESVDRLRRSFAVNPGGL
jgi:hypothetical protein